MRNEAQRDNQVAGDRDDQSVSGCPNCGTLMPHELRFCRACGCRLGEGVEEYTETVRLGDAASTGRAGKSRTASAASAKTSSSGFKGLGAMGLGTGAQSVKSMTGGLKGWKLGRACSRMPRWMLWVLIPIIAVMLADGFSSKSILNRKNRSRSTAVSSAPSSYLGGRYVTTQDGVFLQDATPPDSAADKAGLIGGDIIKSFDGKAVQSDDELSSVLTDTPAGKTVEVVFVRDGETKTVKLTTLSEDENRRLEEAFEKRPAGIGKLGVDDAEVVKVPGTNISGVRLDDISPNLPADMAGVRAGDIVIQFDKTPIRSVRELFTRIQRAVPYSTVNLVLMRDGERLEIPVKVGKR